MITRRNWPTPRSTIVGVVALVASLVAMSSPAAAAGLVRSSATTRATSAAAGSAKGGIQSSRVAFASDVVVVTAATVAANLLSVSTDGSIYVFKSAAGTLSQLKVGKVMLLQDYSVGAVSALSKKPKSFTVTTTPVAMTQLFTTADLTYDQAIDFSNTFADLAPGTVDSAPLRGTDGSLTPATAAGKPPDPKVSLSFNGKAGDFTYGLAVTPSSSKLDWAITGCVGGSFSASKKSCSDSNTGFALDASLTGYITSAKVAGDFDIAKGKNVHSSYKFLSLGGVNFTYEVLRGDSKMKQFNLPVLRIPIGFDIPFVVLGVPMLMKVEFAMLIKLYITSKQSVINGGVKFTYGGSEGVVQTGSSDKAAANAETLKGNFLTSKGSPTPLSSALEFATQMKVGIGPGLAIANILGYADVISALGQETGTTVAGLPCSKFYLDVSGHAYMEAQIAILKVTSSPVTLFDKKASDKKAEC